MFALVALAYVVRATLYCPAGWWVGVKFHGVIFALTTSRAYRATLRMLFLKCFDCLLCTHARTHTHTRMDGYNPTVAIRRSAYLSVCRVSVQTFALLFVHLRDMLLPFLCLQ